MGMNDQPDDLVQLEEKPKFTIICNSCGSWKCEVTADDRGSGSMGGSPVAIVTCLACGNDQDFR